MTTFFDIVQNPNISRPNAGVLENAVPRKRRIYKGGYGRGNRRTEAKPTSQQSLPSTQGFTGQPNINLSTNFYFGNDDLIQNRGFLNVMNSKTANANLIPQNLNPVVVGRQTGERPNPVTPWQIDLKIGESLG